MLWSKKSRTTRHVGIADNDIRRRRVIGCSQLMRHRGTQRRILNRAADRTADVDPVNSGGMLVNHLMMYRAHRSDMVHARCCATEMFCDAHASHSGVDDIVICSSFALLG